MCKLNDKEPDKIYKGLFNVRISPDLHKKISMEALKEGISLNQYVENCLTRYTTDKQNPKREMHVNIYYKVNNVQKNNYSNINDLWSKSKCDKIFVNS